MTLRPSSLIPVLFLAACADSSTPPGVVDDAGKPDATASTLEVDPPVSVADGVSEVLVRVIVRNVKGDSLGRQLPVEVTASGSALVGAVSWDAAESAYTAAVTNTMAETVQIGAVVDGVTLAATRAIDFRAPTVRVDVTASEAMPSAGQTWTLTATLTQPEGERPLPGRSLSLSADSEEAVLGAFVDQGDGRYTAPVSHTQVGTLKLVVVDVASQVSGSVAVEVVPGAPAVLRLSLSSDTTTADAGALHGELVVEDGYGHPLPPGDATFSFVWQGAPGEMAACAAGTPVEAVTPLTCTGLRVAGAYGLQVSAGASLVSGVQPFEVLAGAPAAFSTPAFEPANRMVDADDGSALVSFAVTDAWGNRTTLASPPSVLVTGGNEDAAVQVTQDEERLYLARLTNLRRAGEGWQVALGAGALSEALSFAVVPGRPSALPVVFSRTDVRARETVGAEVRVSDAHGNRLVGLDALQLGYEGAASGTCDPVAASTGEAGLYAFSCVFELHGSYAARARVAEVSGEAATLEVRRVITIANPAFTPANADEAVTTFTADIVDAYTGEPAVFGTRPTATVSGGNPEGAVASVSDDGDGVLRIALEKLWEATRPGQPWTLTLTLDDGSVSQHPFEVVPGEPHGPSSTLSIAEGTKAGTVFSTWLKLRDQRGNPAVSGGRRITLSFEADSGCKSTGFSFDPQAQAHQARVTSAPSTSDCLATATMADSSFVTDPTPLVLEPWASCPRIDCTSECDSSDYDIIITGGCRVCSCTDFELCADYAETQCVYECEGDFDPVSEPDACEYACGCAP